MEHDPVRPIKAKVDKLRLWHSFPVRYCYEFCRVIFIIVGALAGATLAAILCSLATNTPPGQGAVGSTATVIGGVAGLAAGWYLTFLGARIIRAIIPAPSRPDTPGRPHPDTTGMKGC